MALKRLHGDQSAGELFARHRAHVRSIASGLAGRIIDWAGDGCFLTFQTSSAAVAFALRLQQAHKIESDLPGVRIGMHMGEVSEGSGPDDDANHPRVEGLAVDLAARICGLARPAQVLMSSGVADSARQRLDTHLFDQPILWRSHGAYALKGFDEPLEIREVGLESVASFAAPLPGEKAGPVLPLRSGTTSNKSMRAGGIALVLAIAIGGSWWWTTSRQPRSDVEQPDSAETTTQKSIAVLPFADMSERQDQEYLADGMAEEILNLLAQVPDLLVPARSSSFYFKGKQTKISDIARELGVENVLEGSIRRSGNRLRVTAQLVRTDNGYHLWSETYDRNLDDVFKVQDEIANAVVQALQIKLSGGELSRRKGGTQNLEAYQLYLQALSANNQPNVSSIHAAGEYLEKAIELDAEYGLAWSALAANVSMKAGNGILSSTEGFERARMLAQQALQINPDLAGAHVNLQSVHLIYDWDWAAAEAEGRHALALDPTNAYALHAAGMLARVLGRWGDAERQTRSALARDPFNYQMMKDLGVLYLKAGRFAEAEGLSRKALGIAPASPAARNFAALVLLEQGKLEAALAMVHEDDNEENFLLVPVLLQANSRTAEADEALKRQISRVSGWGAYYIAWSYAYRGDRDRTMQWLEKAYTQKDVALPFILSDPLFKRMVDDPRYKAFLRKMNLPDENGVLWEPESQQSPRSGKNAAPPPV